MSTLGKRKVLDRPSSNSSDPQKVPSGTPSSNSRRSNVHHQQYRHWLRCLNSNSRRSNVHQQPYRHWLRCHNSNSRHSNVHQQPYHHWLRCRNSSSSHSNRLPSLCPGGHNVPSLPHSNSSSRSSNSNCNRIHSPSTTMFRHSSNSNRDLAMFSAQLGLKPEQLVSNSSSNSRTLALKLKTNMRQQQSLWVNPKSENQKLPNMQ